MIWDPALENRLSRERLLCLGFLFSNEDFFTDHLFQYKIKLQFLDSFFI